MTEAAFFTIGQAEQLSHKKLYLWSIAEANCSNISDAVSRWAAGWALVHQNLGFQLTLFQQEGVGRRLCLQHYCLRPTEFENLTTPLNLLHIWNARFLN